MPNFASTYGGTRYGWGARCGGLTASFYVKACNIAVQGW